MSRLSRIRKRFTQISPYSLFILNVPVRTYLPALQQFAKETLHSVFLAMGTRLNVCVVLTSQMVGNQEDPVPSSECRSVMSDSVRPRGLYSPWNSPGQNTGVGSLSLLQGIFPTQGSNQGLLHCGRFLYQLSFQGSLIFVLGDTQMCQELRTRMSGALGADLSAASLALPPACFTALVPNLTSLAIMMSKHIHQNYSK